VVLTIAPDLVNKQPVTFQSIGDGAVSVVAGVGVTIQSLEDNLTLAGKFASFTIVPKTTNVYGLIGALVAGDPYADDDTETLAAIAATDLYLRPGSGKFFEDTAETTAATTSGDFVRSWVRTSTHARTVRQTGADGVVPRLASNLAAASFNGTNQFYALDAEYFLSNTGQTLGARFRADTDASGTRVLVGGQGTSPFPRGWISLTNGVASCAVGAIGSDGNKDPADTDLRSASAWHTIFATWNSTTLLLYVDGVEVRSTTRPVGDTVAFLGTRIGARRSPAGTDLFFKGDISHVVIADSVFTGTEISDIHDAWSAS